MSHVDAWKAVIDFNKTTISVASAVLTALVAYLRISGSIWEMSLMNTVPVILLLVAAALAIFSFGRSISALKSGESAKHGVLFANLGFFALALGILSLALVTVGSDRSIREILELVEAETAGFRLPLSPSNCHSIELRRDQYVLRYSIGDQEAMVTLSVDDHSILSIE